MDAERSVRRFVGTIVALAAVIGLAAALFVGVDLALGELTAWPFALAILFGCAIYVVTRAAVPFEWAGRRFMVSFEEGIVLLALAVLHPALVVFAVAIPGLLAHAMSGRRPLKVAFNGAMYALAIGAAAAVSMYATSKGLAPLLAALPSVLAYVLVSNVLVAFLFARLEGGNAARIFASRFLLPAGLQAAIGAALGVALVGLWLHHPLAVLTLGPFVYFARGYGKLQAEADRKLEVHRRLAGISQSLTGGTSTDVAAEHVLSACGDLFSSGRATLRLTDTQGVTRTWSHDFEGGAHPTLDPIEAEIPGPGGAAPGLIAVYPSRKHAQSYGALERELLRIVASQAASAIGNAAALAYIHELKDVHEGIVTHVPAGIIRLDPAGRITQVNEAALRMFGACVELGREPLAADEHWAPFPDLRERFVGLLRGESFQDFEIGIHEPAAAEGAPETERCYSLAGVPLADGSIILANDITARKQAEEAVRRQTITRPLVRRIVLNLVQDLDMSRYSVAQMGRSLAAEARSSDIHGFVAAFWEMGLGELRFEGAEGDAYKFVADDLLERQRKSRQPSCHLALGYLEGSVAKVTGGEALGSELKCQSQGHPRCEFVVHARKPVPKPIRRVAAVPPPKST